MLLIQYRVDLQRVAKICPSFSRNLIVFFTQVLKFDRLLNCVLVKLSLCDLEH